jgi:light-independent protochlorophyllide reductase subunit N
MYDGTDSVVERDDFCSLAPIGWLHHKMQDSFFLVVGTGSCQGFLQTALGVMIFAQPRFATAMLDEDDLAGRDTLEALRPLVRAVVEEHAPRAIFLASTCTPEILKMNVAGCAPPLEAEYGVRIYPTRMDGFDASYTQGEDHVLGSMIARAPRDDRANLVILGCLSALEEAEIRLECAAMGVPVPEFLPGESALALPAFGPQTVIAPAHPFLYDACAYAARERKCRVLATLFPYGPDGTRAFYEAIGAAFGRDVSYEAREAAAWRACEPEIAPLRDRGIAFASDSLLELPLARTLRAAGARVPFVATPKVYKKFHASESVRLGDLEVLAAADRYEVFARLSAAAPDLVVANLNVANALEGMGFNVKWSTELTFQPIRGFAGSPALFRLFASSLRRHDRLAAKQQAAGSAEHPIDLDYFRLASV